MFVVMFLHLFGLRESENVRLGKGQGLPIQKCPYLKICYFICMFTSIRTLSLKMFPNLLSVLV